MGYQTMKTNDGKTETVPLIQITTNVNVSHTVGGTPISRRKNFLNMWGTTTGTRATKEGTDWKDWRKRCLMGDKDFEGQSMFNKKKWLPLCQQAPFKISHYCCNVMKKAPIGKYQRKNNIKPIVGTMTEESRIRKQAWLRHGCNAFASKKPMSQPMSFWTEQDVLEYIDKFHIDIASVYGEVVYENNKHQITLDHESGGQYVCTGCRRTGCIFCGFGMHLEKGDECRFVRLKKTHPKQYDYCIGGGQWVDNPDYDPDYNGEPDWMGWIDWNPPKLWVPSKEGLGMGYVFDKCNEIYGKEMWKY